MYEVHYKNLELDINNEELKRFINEIEFLFSNLYSKDPTLENLVEIYEEIIRNIK